MRLAWAIVYLSSCSFVVGQEPVPQAGQPCDDGGACAPGFRCNAGTCQAADAGTAGAAAGGTGGMTAGGSAGGGRSAGGTAAPDGGCSVSTERTACPFEQICRDSACTLGCRTSADCLPSQTCTSGPTDAGVCFEARWYQRTLSGTGPPGVLEGSGAHYDETSSLVMVMKEGQWFGLAPADGGFAWVSVPSIGSPQTLWNFASGWDPQRRRLVIQGGTYPGAPTCDARRETWSYSGAATDWTQFDSLSTR